MKTTSKPTAATFVLVVQRRDPSEALQHAIDHARDEARRCRLAHARAPADVRARMKLQRSAIIADSVGDVLRRAESEGPRPEAEDWERVWLPQLLARLRRGPPSPRPLAEVLLLIGDERINQAPGTAGCIALGEGSYLFFGRSRVRRKTLRNRQHRPSSLDATVVTVRRSKSRG